MKFSCSLTLAVAFLFTAVFLNPVIALAQFGETTPVPDDWLKGFDSITPESAKKVLDVLAGPAFEGRGTGQPGFVRAAHWVAGQLAELGLEPVGDQETFFQMVPILRREVDLSQCKITGPNGLEIAGQGNLGFDRMTEIPEVAAEVVVISFAGENASLPQALSLRDKIVVYTSDDQASARAPFLLARKRPAAAFRVVDGQPQSRSIISFPGGRRRSTSFSGSITRAAATQIVEAVGGQADWLTPQTTVQVHATGKNLTMTASVREEQAGTPNVVAWLEGSDPQLRNEYVVIGAHLDHLGVSRGQVFPGADDNGSGSTAILMIAKALAANPVKPKRSVLFIWFTGEEMGLQGSRYYVNNPSVPLDKMIAMLNIDMVGRNEETRDETAEENEGHLHLVGSKRGDTDLHGLVLEANQHTGFEFEFDQEGVFGRSDQINFYRKGVPVAFLFGGFHPDYHQPSDKVKEINFNKIAQAARLFYCAAFKVADHGPFELKQGED